MSAKRPVLQSGWVLEAKGVDGQPVPPSVLAEWRRYQYLAWYARRRHTVIEISGLVVSAAIPVLAAYAIDSRLIAAVGSLAVLIGGIRALGSYKESWTTRTRARYEIEKEIALFAAQHGKYAAPDAATALVEAVEDICTRQREGWAALHQSYGSSSPAKSTAVAPADRP